MWKSKVTPAQLAHSVIAVPPLARNKDREVCETENAKLIRWLESGGIKTLLYGGNAVFYHLRPSEFSKTLRILVDTAGDDTWVIPSVGPSYGLMMDQAEVLREFDFPTVMVLPQREIADEHGIASGIRMFAERLAKPVVLYLKHDRWLSKQTVSAMFRDGIVSWIKYAVVRNTPENDPYLREILEAVPSDLVVSGMGEQPAIVHMRDFGIGSFTSGCVCLSPSRSQRMLQSIQNRDYAVAEQIREQFRPLEDLRNAIQPIRVLHCAVAAAEIANTGPMQPMLGELDELQLRQVTEAARVLARL